MTNLEITDVVIKKVVENKGHIGFASCVINKCIRLNNIAIFKRLNKDGYRLVFPEKKFGENKVQIFFPLTNDAYFLLEKAITESL